MPDEQADISAFPTYEYTTYPRQFVSYRWFKPILVAALTFVFMLIFQMAIIAVAVLLEGDVSFLYDISADFDAMNPYTLSGALVYLGGVGVLLPALALSLLIVRERPFSSCSSSRGGWSWGAFFKCIGIAIAVLAVMTIAQLIVSPAESDAAWGTDAVRFTVVGFIACTVLVPLQCMAEEYVFRGYLMQALGAWTKWPVLALLVQAAIFTAMHPYNLLGMVAVFVGAVIQGIVVQQTRGLEATSALHIVNNLLAFYLGGFGLQAITSNIDALSLVFAIATDALFAVAVLYLARKRSWFKAKGDGVSTFNARVLERRANRAGCAQPPQQGGI